MKSPEQIDVARGLSEAFEPLIDVCLSLGITSPELEALLRAAFVQRAFVKLPRHPRTDRGPSDSRVSLATGVHRSEVAKIRSAPGATGVKSTMARKQQLYSRSARILQGWSTDARFLTSGGVPLDLPLERNRERRSFEDLVEKYAPGNHPGSALKELRRRGTVDLLEDGIVRFRLSASRTDGLTKANVASAARRMRQLGRTLVHNISNPKQRRLHAETAPMKLNAQQLALIQALLERRAKSFLDGIEGEFQVREESTLHQETKQVGISVYSWEEE
jgi:Family of unknown function (DUF6502)